MRLKGLFRLWLVLTLIGVPLVAGLDFQQKVNFWNDMDKTVIKNCVDTEFQDPTHPDALECGRKQGTYKTVFERESTTPGVYWSQQLGYAFLEDLILTAGLAVAFLVGRWVWRGFLPPAPK